MSVSPNRPFQVLCLSGGGYLGLFSARVLAAFEQRIGAPIHTRFDLIAGTSAGGLIALGLAGGQSAAHIADLMEDRGRAIFPPPRSGRMLGTVRGLFRPKYDGIALRAAVQSIVGDGVLKPGRPQVMVPAVSLTTGSTVLFRSAAPPAPDLKLADIAMATAAAPLYFPTASVGAGRYTDGGLAANAPDLLALLHAESELGIAREVIRVMSVGTTMRPIGLPAGGNPNKGVLAWMSNLFLVDLAMSCQMNLVQDMMRLLLGEQHYLRIDAVVSRAQAGLLKLDNASGDATGTLNALAAHAARDALERPAVQLMLATRAPSV